MSYTHLTPMERTKIEFFLEQGSRVTATGTDFRSA